MKVMIRTIVLAIFTLCLSPLVYAEASSAEVTISYYVDRGKVVTPRVVTYKGGSHNNMIINHYRYEADEVVTNGCEGEWSIKGVMYEVRDVRQDCTVVFSTKKSDRHIPVLFSLGLQLPVGALTRNFQLNIGSATDKDGKPFLDRFNVSGTIYSVSNNVERSIGKFKNQIINYEGTDDFSVDTGVRYHYSEDASIKYIAKIDSISDCYFSIFYGDECSDVFRASNFDGYKTFIEIANRNP